MTFIVPAVLGGLALSVMALVSLAAARKGKHPAQPQLPQVQPRILIHSINDDRCTGCDACVAVCPTNVLDLINNKSRVVRFQDCIQCEACMWACPTEALVMHLEGTDPPPLRVPEIDEYFQTAVPGQYLIGEVAGKPLVKNAANLGRMVVEHMLSTGLRARGDGGQTVDVAIVGSGPGGLSAALTCLHHGLSYVLLEKEQLIASTVARYPKGKLVMAEPYDTRNYSFLPVFDSSKEQLVPLWEELIRAAGVHAKLGEAVEEVVQGGDGMFDIRTTVARYRAQRVVLGIGTRGKPRTLGVPGENLPKVQSLLDDPDEFRDQPVLVVGGGDSAVEAAIALADAGAHVILSYRGRSFNRAQPKIKQTIESYAAQRRIKIKYQSQVVQLDHESVVIQMADGQQRRYPNQAAFILIGSDPPVKWLERLGIHFVERPHSFEFGKTDDVLRDMLQGEVVDCPEDAHSAAVLIRDGRLPEGVSPAVAAAEMGAGLEIDNEPPSGARKWLRSATAIFSMGRKEEKQPIPLSEFARRGERKHTGHGRRDELAPSERTRILRMLRDDGARIADEESRIDIVPPPAPAPHPIDVTDEDSDPYFMPTVLNEAALPPAASPPSYPRGNNPPSYPRGNNPPNYPRGGNQDAGRLFGGPDGSPAKPAVIVGLAQAKERAKQPQATVIGRKKPPSIAPAPAPSAKRTYSSTFDDEATRQIDSDSALAQLLRDSVRDEPPKPPPPRGYPQPAPDPRLAPSDFGAGGALMADADEPTMHVDVSSSLHPAGFRPSPVAPPDASTHIVDRDSFLSSEDATRALDVSGLARHDARASLVGDDFRTVDEFPVGDDDPTGALDLDLDDDPARRESWSDIEWDLD